MVAWVVSELRQPPHRTTPHTTYHGTCHHYTHPNPPRPQVRATRDVGLPSTKSPLQLFAERLLAVQRLAAEAVAGRGAGVAAPLDWYIMATPATVAPITKFLSDNAFFGLQAAQVGAGMRGSWLL